MDFYRNKGKELNFKEDVFASDTYHLNYDYTHIVVPTEKKPYQDS